MKPCSNLSILTFSLFFLSACATSPIIPTNPAERLAQAMDGEFLRLPDASQTPLRDKRIRIDPLGPGEWLYYQINEGENLSEVYRQRVLQLRTDTNGRVIQTAYSLKTPEPLQAFDAAAITTLTLNDIEPTLGAGCDLIWIEMGDGWAGRIDPADCLIVSQRRQTEIRIGTRTDLIGDRLRQAESGYDLDGNRIWGSEDGEWMVLRRQK